MFEVMREGAVHAAYGQLSQVWEMAPQLPKEVARYGDTIWMWLTACLEVYFCSPKNQMARQTFNTQRRESQTRYRPVAQKVL